MPTLPVPAHWALAFLPFVLVSIFTGLGLAAGGGADSPAAAVTGLITATARGDALAAVALVDPHEVEIIEPVSSKLASRLDDIEVDDQQSMDAFDAPEAIDVQLSGVEVETEVLRPGVARVDVVDGSLHVRLDPTKLPPDLRESFEESGDDTVESWELADLAREATNDEDQSTYLVAVQRDGRWYVSFAATVAEYASEASGIDYVDGLVPGSGGAASPEEAITSLVAALPGT
nr:hypothetical protein [Micromonospora sp. DSM 115978]